MRESQPEKDGKEGGVRSCQPDADEAGDEWGMLMKVQPHGSK